MKFAIIVILFLAISITEAEIHRARPGNNFRRSKNRPVLPQHQIVSNSSFRRWMDSEFFGHKNSIWLYSSLSAGLVGLSGLFPLLVIPLGAADILRSGGSTKSLRLLLSFAIGGLLGDVFLHLLPEAWNHIHKFESPHAGNRSISLWILAGMLSFLFIEKIFPDDVDDKEESDDESESILTDMKSTENILSKGSENFIQDGLLKLKDVLSNNCLSLTIVTPTLMQQQPIKSRKNIYLPISASNKVNAESIHISPTINTVDMNKDKMVEGNDNLILSIKKSSQMNTNDSIVSDKIDSQSTPSKVEPISIDCTQKKINNDGVKKNDCKISNDDRVEMNKIVGSSDKTEILKVTDNIMKAKPIKIKTSGWLNLVANVIDNFTHGLAVAGSYCISPKMGLLTTFAILLHEIPHEIGDFAILLRSGFDRWAAARAQFFTAFGGIVGALLALSAESTQIAGDITAWILPFTAGGFINIALVTVIPDILKEVNPWESLKQVLMICIGIFMMASITIIFD